jgi:hypothetical protein
MAWWKFGKRKSETAEADWVGEQLAEMLDPEPTLQEVRNRHHLAPNDIKPFLALASLSVAGARIGLNQESIVTRVDKDIIVKVHHSFCSALVWNYGNRHHPERSPSELVLELVKLANKVTDAFYANSKSKPPLPLPHWFACKEIIAYLQNGEPASNPESIMIYSEYLSIGMRTTKVFVDELLARNVQLVE